MSVEQAQKRVTWLAFKQAGRSAKRDLSFFSQRTFRGRWHSDNTPLRLSARNSGMEEMQMIVISAVHAWMEPRKLLAPFLEGFDSPHTEGLRFLSVLVGVKLGLPIGINCILHAQIVVHENLASFSTHVAPSVARKRLDGHP